MTLLKIKNQKKIISFKNIFNFVSREQTKLIIKYFEL